MNKKIAFIMYAWGTTALFVFIIFWLATVPYLGEGNSMYDEVIKVLYRMTLYGLLFLLMYRSFIATLRTTVTRLSKWHSHKEKSEDTEFVLIVESLLLLVSILSSIIIAGIDEFIQASIIGRSAQIQDVLISTMAVLLTAILVYSSPMLGELEIAIKHKFFTPSTKKRGIK